MEVNKMIDKKNQGFFSQTSSKKGVQEDV